MFTPTDKQRAIIETATGHFLVRACPGSGKTFTIAIKALLDMQTWESNYSGIALLSFTNVAQEEFGKQIEDILPSARIKHPHFLGTLDSFINRYIFFQFSYLLGIDATLIKMIGEPFGGSYIEYESGKLSLRLIYAIDGALSLSVKDAQSAKQPLIDAAKAAKSSLIKRNRFTQADANFFSLKILLENPEVIDCLAARFPFLYIDEAQDTTPVHWEIIRLLANSTQNKRFGVIGDPDQSIYAWNGAKPELFNKYATKLETLGKVFILNDSRRSSQNICNFYYPLSSLNSIPKAIDERIAKSDEKPKVIYYDKDNHSEIKALIESFKKDNTNHLILCRSLDLIKKIYRIAGSNSVLLQENPWAKNSMQAYNLLKSKFELDSRDFRSSLYRAEELIFVLNKEYERSYFLEKLNLSQREWFESIELELDKLPATIGKTIDVWAEEARKIVPTLDYFKNIECIPKIKTKIANHRAMLISDYFSSSEQQVIESSVQTIHGAKGKTTDSVFLILNARHANHIIRALSNKPAKNESETSLDEKRMIYVAITRARTRIVLCAPSSSQKKLNEAMKLVC